MKKFIVSYLVCLIFFSILTPNWELEKLKTLLLMKRSKVFEVV